MSDTLHHECGIAMVRLLRPLDFYRNKYGTAAYGMNKLYLLLEKQHNRGQDGVGVAGIRLNPKAGSKYIMRERSASRQGLAEIFDSVLSQIHKVQNGDSIHATDAEWMKNNLRFVCELYLGHLRYGTFGKYGIDNVHPFLRENNWLTRNLAVAGNFNLTNVDELFDQLVEIGQHPIEKTDTVTVLEKIGHFLDEENEDLFRKFKMAGKSNKEISPLIGKHLNIQKILSRSAKSWDGGYTIAGMIGHGDAFVMRDPHGIRPAFWYRNDEVVVVASERPAIQTAFNVPLESIHEIKPGHALIIKKDGIVSEEQFREPQEKKSCSFERIYFSRGSDADIYKERKELGRLLCSTILQAVDKDLKHTVFSFIPNTAEVAFYGMVKGMEGYLTEVKKRKILKEGSSLTEEKLSEILSIRPRVEKIAIKDAKLRTFITDDSQRNELVAHVYDITYGTLRKGEDNLVVIDDSIVRGTTLRNSIVKILDRLSPKKIVIVSSAPQIRYPDCYGIDMAKIGDLIAFRAAIALLEDNNMEHVIDEVHHKCKEVLESTKPLTINPVKAIYKPFTAEQISDKISSLLKPEGLNAELQIIYQKIEDLHTAIPNHSGDWYFSGDYP
ncbi:MAG: class II glutamine amidotransferase, partial [Bacteroidia bacterium]|nr:class II glutamine amidotransferase [Bacteroidia bacterium]